MDRFDIVIVGAGHGGAQAAQALRQNGYQCSIALIGDEAVVPYDRPGLSKEYLAGKKPFDRLRLRPESFWDERSIALLLGRRMVSVDAAAHLLDCDDGSRLSYGTLIWATGGAPRRLTCPGHDHPAVRYLRSKADCDRLIAALPSVRRAVIVGGGYIGLEAAAVLRELGKDVTLVEAQDRVLARVAAEPVSRFYEAEHRARGVEILLGTGVGAILAGEAGYAVRLTDGRALPAELIIAGIGITPEIGPLVAAGAEAGDGVMVDAYCRTSLPDVYCIGDCALLRDGPGIRIESVQNANDQATAVAKALCGTPAPYAATPWFWSNQYDLRLQTVGLNHRYDATVLRGDPATRSFSLIYLREGRVIAADCINATRDFVQARRLVETGFRASPERLRNAEVPLKELSEAA
jgi:3-phenylpropionate/trans-cinnamate dioxygenase ferredoxin reductase subunit